MTDINSSEFFLILPNQLFETNRFFDKAVTFCLVEEYLFFNQYNFHKQKLVLHRASMKAWQSAKESAGFKVHYVEFGEGDIQSCIQNLALNGLKKLIAFRPVDDWEEKRIERSCIKNDIELSWVENPNFLNPIDRGKEFFKGKSHFHQTDYYIHQRRERGILLEDNGKPVGGKWTFDAENREKLPKSFSSPTIKWPKHNKFVEEAINYVNLHFSSGYGKAENFCYPVTRKESLNWLTQFLDERFSQFGKYEDAMSAAENILFHSVLTPVLNIGLLSPDEVLTAAIEKGQSDSIPINSMEGFIRQIMGWREFIRIVYELKGGKQRTTNFWGFTRKIPSSFYTGDTGIIPVDMVIKKVLNTSYNHHIERLMVLGNFFLLCEFDPDEVYRWFMEMYIDAYDWVMVPNVYGMTQFADGGLMTTKPYISGSNYLLKMGDWPKGEWQKTWDGLFWRFMHVHRTFFQQNPRLGMLITTFDKMSEEKRNHHLQNAESFLKQLDLSLLKETITTE